MRYHGRRARYGCSCCENEAIEGSDLSTVLLTTQSGRDQNAVPFCCCEQKSESDNG